MARTLIVFLFCFFFSVTSFSQGILREGEFNDPYNEKPRLPRYQGGDEALNKFIENDLKYPNNKRPSQAQVTWLTFTVDLKGMIQNIRVDKTSGQALDNEAIRTLKKTKGKWTPGIRYGRFAEMETTVYFKFKSW